MAQQVMIPRVGERILATLAAGELSTDQLIDALAPGAGPVQRFRVRTRVATVLSQLRHRKQIMSRFADGPSTNRQREAFHRLAEKDA